MQTSIEILGLETYGYHGLFDEEQRLGQKFSYDIDARLGPTPSHQADDLSHSVRYDALVERAVGISSGSRFATLEALGEAIAIGLLESFPLIESVSVGVRKLSPPINHHLRTAGVSVQLSRVASP